MAATQLAIIISAKDLASGALAGVGKSLGAISTGLGGVASAAAAPTRALGGVVDVLGKVGLAGMGITALAGAARGLGEALGIGLNVEMENVRAQLMAFTKDGPAASKILDDITKEAAKTPFAFAEMAKATAGLLPAAKQSGMALMDLVRQAEILAASNPAQGLQGAAFALREAVSGDFTSVIERFNLPRSYINQLKEQGVPALEIVQRAMKEVGFDLDLVSNLSQTASGRWSTFQDTIDGLKRTISAPLFDILSKSLAGMQGFLDDNIDTFNVWASTLGSAIGREVTNAIGTAGKLVNVLVVLSDVLRSGGVDAGIAREIFARLVPPSVADALVNVLGLLASLRNRFAEMLPVVGAFIQDAISKIPGAIAQIEAFVTALRDRLMGAISDLAPTGERLAHLFGTIRDAVLALIPNPLIDLVNGLIRTAQEAGKNTDVLATLVAAVNTMSGTVDVATRFLRDHKEMQAILVGIVGALATAWTLSTAAAIAHSTAIAVQTLATQGLAAAQGVLNAIMAANPIGLVVVALAGLAAGLIYAYNTSEDFRRTVDTSFAAVKQTVTGVVAAVQEQINMLVGLWQISATLQRAIEDLGRSMIRGLIEGINQMVGGLQERVREIINSIPKAVRDLLGIGSPSRVFFTIGQQIIDGLIAGLRDRKTEYIDAIVGVARDSLSLFESIISRTSFAGGVISAGGIFGRGAGAAKDLQDIFRKQFGWMFGASSESAFFASGIFTAIEDVRKSLAGAALKSQTVGIIRDLVVSLEDLGQAVPPDLARAIGLIADELGGPFRDAINDLVSPTQSAMRGAMRDLQTFVGEAQFARQLASTASLMASIGQTLPDMFRTMLADLGAGTTNPILRTVIDQLLNGVIPGFQGGGVISGALGQPSLALVHGGERVISAGGGDIRALVDAIANQPIVIEIDGQAVAEIVRQRLILTRRANVDLGFS